MVVKRDAVVSAGVLKSAFVVALCGYEQGAIITGRVPTISSMCREHPVLGFGGVVALFTWHIWFERGAPFGRPS